jgi:glycine cleavage system transcriptional repressor
VPAAAAQGQQQRPRAARYNPASFQEELPVRTWFLISAVGRDRPGIVADLAQLIFDAEANLEDSRMTILGNEFAAILLCSGRDPQLGRRLTEGARRIEWENRLTVFIRPLEGAPRPPVPAPGTRLYRLRAEGLDRAGIVAALCRVLADHSVNIADLRSQSVPSPSGSALYRMEIAAEVPETLPVDQLHKALEAAASGIDVDVVLEPAGSAQ